ncbi:MAG: tetratricopeptide repeat protein [Pirellulaceae bacterium]|nr:tetratricopeptide repeat protein [Pirellulaceae bacterium]
MPNSAVTKFFLMVNLVAPLLLISSGQFPVTCLADEQSPSKPASGPLQPGDVVLVARQGVELREKEQVLLKLQVGSEFTVQAVKADWIGGAVRLETGWRTGWIKPADLVRFEDALAQFEAQLKQQPNNYDLLLAKARLLRDQDQLDEALAVYDQAVKIRPRDKSAYRQRGYVWYLKDQPAKAVSEYNRVLELDPQDGLSWTNRGLNLQALGKFSEALRDYERASALSDQNALARNNAAWIRATCPDARLRSGSQAVELATKACELTSYENPDFLDTLAAAHAESEDFDAAVRLVERAMALATAEDQAELKQRRDLYQSGKPYRLPPAAP